METREVEPPSADERHCGGEVHVGGENLRDLPDPHRRRVEGWGKDFHDVSLETAPELRRLDPALRGPAVHGLPDPTPGALGPPPRRAARRLPRRGPRPPRAYART